MNFHLLDDQHLEVLAGDIASGIWNYASGVLSRDGEKSVQVDGNTKSMEIRLKRQVSSLDTMSDLPVGGLLGTALNTVLGPVGGLASGAIGAIAGKVEFVCIGCQLVDGRKFICRMRNSMLKEWRKFCSDVSEKPK